MGKPLGGLLDVMASSGTEATGGGGGGGGASEGGFFSSLMNALSGKGDVMSILADQAGQKMNPTGSNIFGGIGTSLAKSRMAGEKLAQDKSDTETMLTKIIQDLGSSSNMNKVGIIKNPDGTIKVDQQTTIPKHIDDTLPLAEKTVSADKTERQKSVGSMQDMMEMYK